MLTYNIFRKNRQRSQNETPRNGILQWPYLMICTPVQLMHAWSLFNEIRSRQLSDSVQNVKDWLLLVSGVSLIRFYMYRGLLQACESQAIPRHEPYHVGVQMGYHRGLHR